MWDECNCAVVEHSLALPFFGIEMKMDLFQSCGHCGVFQICWHIECSTFTASSFRIWNSSTGIPSPPLALFIVMLPKAHLTSPSGCKPHSLVKNHDTHPILRMEKEWGVDQLYFGKRGFRESLNVGLTHEKWWYLTFALLDIKDMNVKVQKTWFRNCLIKFTICQHQLIYLPKVLTSHLWSEVVVSTPQNKSKWNSQRLSDWSTVLSTQKIQMNLNPFLLLSLGHWTRAPRCAF